MPKYTPTKPKVSGRKRPGHEQCSKKRTVLKERIRDLNTLVDDLESKYRLQELRVDILNDVLKTVIETMGLEQILDPFGAGLTREKDEGKQLKDPPP